MDVGAKYLNGESENDWPGASLKEPSIARPVPSQVSFRTILEGKKKLFMINFDDIETMAAFEKLGENGRKVYLEFEPKIPRTHTKVRLYNDKESIELKKYKSEDW